MVTTLQVYYSSFGKWTGRVLVDGVKVCHISGCNSRLEVEVVARQKGHFFDILESV